MPTSELGLPAPRLTCAPTDWLTDAEIDQPGPGRRDRVSRAARGLRRLRGLSGRHGRPDQSQFQHLPGARLGRLRRDRCPPRAEARPIRRSGRTDHRTQHPAQPGERRHRDVVRRTGRARPRRHARRGLASPSPRSRRPRPDPSDRRLRNRAVDRSSPDSDSIRVRRRSSRAWSASGPSWSSRPARPGARPGVDRPDRRGSRWGRGRAYPRWAERGPWLVARGTAAAMPEDPGRAELLRGPRGTRHLVPMPGAWILPSDDDPWAGPPNIVQASDGSGSGKIGDPSVPKGTLHVQDGAPGAAGEPAEGDWLVRVAKTNPCLPGCTARFNATPAAARSHLVRALRTDRRSGCRRASRTLASGIVLTQDQLVAPSEAANPGRQHRGRQGTIAPVILLVPHRPGRRRRQDRADAGVLGLRPEPQRPGPASDRLRVRPDGDLDYLGPVAIGQANDGSTNALFLVQTLQGPVLDPHGRLRFASGSRRCVPSPKVTRRP